MTTIQTVLDLLGTTPTALSKMTGYSVQSVCFWRDGLRTIPPEACVVIERATDCAVTRRELRPLDWWRIWPELVTEDFPAPESREEAA